MVSQAEDNPQEMQVEQALAEYMMKCDSGEMPDREAFFQQHPELREQLLELLNAADWIEELAGPTVSDIAAEDDPLAVTADIEETIPQLGGFPDGTRAAELTLPVSELSGRGLPDDPADSRGLSQPVLPCRFGDYVLERVLGRGGMGVVYYGHQVRLDRPVAIKMIRSGALASQEEVQRFYAEARSAAKLDHPNIVTVYQCGEHDGHRFFSMDYVPGVDLSKKIKDGPIDCKEAVRYVRDVARAIQYAHDRGILHRDLKPANILVDDNQVVHITDFGLAKSVGHETGLTATGAALGTPSYMSPEQAAGRVDEQHHATDIYSLGAILFTLVTGKPPFKAGSVVQTIMQVIHRPAPMARSVNEKLDADIETIIDVCLQKAPERRYQSAGMLADDLDRYLLGSPIQARPLSQIRRAWYWLLGVPIFGAVLDNRVVEPTDAHRWVQRGLISAGLLIMAAWMLMLIPSSVWYKNRMPRTIRVAAGANGGNYDRLARTICKTLVEKTGCEAVPIRTAGSSENIDRLERGDVDLALLQADAVGSSAIAVVAPLYYEAVHILVKSELNILTIDQFKSRRVVVGSEKAGAHSIARLLLGRSGLSLDDIEIDRTDWRGLKENPIADAAIVVSKLGSPDLAALLTAGRYHLLAIPDSWQFALDEPAFHPLLVLPKSYPECGLPDTGIATVATTAFLAAKTETPAVLIHEVLKSLFDPELVRATGILSAERAAHWQGIAWHPAAREFFQSYRGISPHTSHESSYQANALPSP